MPGMGLLRSSSHIGIRLFSSLILGVPIRRLSHFFYNRVPKAANTSITQTFFTHSAYSPRLARRDNPKYKFQRPIFLSINQAHKLEHEAFKFTFVRNSYSRASQPAFWDFAAISIQADFFWTCTGLHR